MFLKLEYVTGNGLFRKRRLNFMGAREPFATGRLLPRHVVPLRVLEHTFSAGTLRTAYSVVRFMFRGRVRQFVPYLLVIIPCYGKYRARTGK